jgi:hypothetical protein
MVEPKSHIKLMRRAFTHWRFRSRERWPIEIDQQAAIVERHLIFLEVEDSPSAALHSTAMDDIEKLKRMLASPSPRFNPKS